MRREEIEQLLAGYTDGSLTKEENLKLRELLSNDAALREEADEISAVWRRLEETTGEPSRKMDTAFYSFLNEAKQQPKQHKVIPLKLSWIRSAAAIAACVAAFVIGRYSIGPVEVVKYKTIVREVPGPVRDRLLPAATPAVAVARQAKEKMPSDSKTGLDNSALSQQLRSVYTSERISAVMQITAGGNISDADLQRLSLALREDPSPNVRLTILDALRPIAARPNVQAVLISQLQRGNDDLVKSSVVDLLIDTRAKNAIPQMLAMLENKDTNPRIQDKIKAGIESYLN